MIAFEIWDIKVYWYGIFYLITFLFGYGFLYIISRKGLKWYPEIASFLQKYLDDLIIYIFAWVVIWGRLGEVLIYNLDYYISYPSQIFAIWNGGMSFVGGFVGVMMAIFLFGYIYKLKFYHLLIIFDLICLILPLGIFLGRWGNHLNQELYGKVVDSKSIWPSYFQLFRGLDLITIYNNIDNQLRWNNNLFEMIFEWLMILWINFLIFIKKVWYGIWKPGIITWLFCVLYSIIRFILETLRDNPPNEYFYGILKSQIWMIPLFLLGLWLISSRRTLHR